MLIFSLDGSITFQPEGLDIDVTPERILELSKAKEHSKALNYAFRLNEEKYLIRVVENIKMDEGIYVWVAYLLMYSVWFVRLFSGVCLIIDILSNKKVRRSPISLTSRALGFYCFWAFNKGYSVT